MFQETDQEGGPSVDERFSSYYWGNTSLNVDLKECSTDYLLPNPSDS